MKQTIISFSLIVSACMPCIAMEPSNPDQQLMRLIRSSVQTFTNDQKEKQWETERIQLILPLLSAGANPNAIINGIPSAPLHEALQVGLPYIVAFLLQHGADPRANAVKTLLERTDPVMYRYYGSDMAYLLFVYGAIIPTERSPQLESLIHIKFNGWFTRPVASNDEASLRRALKVIQPTGTADWNKDVHQWLTEALLLAAAQGNVLFVTLLLEAGAQSNPTIQSRINLILTRNLAPEDRARYLRIQQLVEPKRIPVNPPIRIQDLLNARLFRPSSKNFLQ